MNQITENKYIFPFTDFSVSPINRSPIFDLVFGTDELCKNINEKIMKFLPGIKGKNWTNINKAAASGHLNIVKKLFEQGKVPDESGVYNAIKNGHFEVVKYLHENNVSLQTEYSTTVYGKRYVILKYLAERGYDVRSALIQSIVTSNIGYIKMLHNSGCRLSSQDLVLVYRALNNSSWIRPNIKTIFLLCDLGYNFFDRIDFLSEEAEVVVRKYKNIVCVWENLQHDGYDDFGPESDLWDLYVLYRENNKQKFHRYHREDWWNGRKEEYYLY